MSDHDRIASVDNSQRNNRRRARRGPGAIPANFVEQIEDARAIGRNDDEIAWAYGITTDTLYTRFNRFGIKPGKRWRDIEDNRAMLRDNGFSRHALRHPTRHRRAS
jgi:hypothetical protein